MSTRTVPHALLVSKSPAGDLRRRVHVSKARQDLVVSSILGSHIHLKKTSLPCYLRFHVIFHSIYSTPYISL